MRLHSIKLAGFKSFVEPVTFALPGQLVGVVGPNGCGKSNIIDAVRWVLGESKASELRGESMQDVIFNGSHKRKPAGRASVELVFDNADHRAGGQWSAFAEIAVKRVLTRDGASSYYINNQLVRRRDVQDVFLGTGLGPRAYAIIGQGTISRIIESRPQDLRLFLEEAAGISKYKERRRETENRLHDARQNLLRVEDILRELDSSLAKLEQQAELAKKYQALTAAAHLKQQQFWFLQQDRAQAEQLRSSLEVQQAETALQTRLADLQQLQVSLEAVRQAHHAAAEELNQAQGQLYQASSDIGRFETQIRFVAQARQGAEQRLATLAQQALQWASQVQEAQAGLECLCQQEQVAQEKEQALQQQLKQHSQQTPKLEQELLLARQNSQQQMAAVAQLQQQIGVLAAEQRGLAEQLRQFNGRASRLQQDRLGLLAPDEAALQQLQHQLVCARQQVSQLNAQLLVLQQSAPQLEAQRCLQQQLLSAEAARLADVSARLEALTSLQQRLQTNSRLQLWLQQHGLDDLTALWQQLHIEPGWEGALEAALRERLQALPIAKLEQLDVFVDDLPPAKLVFYDPAAAAVRPDDAGLKPLFDLLHGCSNGQQALLQDWLAGCFVADSLSAALQLRCRLQPGQGIFVAAGHVVQRSSVSFYAPDGEQSGLLARAREIEQLQCQKQAQILLHEAQSSALAKAQAACIEVTQQLQTLGGQSSQAQSSAHQLEVELLHLSQAHTQARQRQAQIDTDLAELQTQTQEARARSADASQRLATLEVELRRRQQQGLALEDALLAAKQRLQLQQDAQRQLEHQTQEAGFALRSLVLRRADLRRASDSAERQQTAVLAQRQQVQAELSALHDDDAQNGLQQVLALKLACERTLGCKRSQYDDLSAQLRGHDERRLQLERSLEPLRQRITDAQLKEQAARLSARQYSDLLANAGADVVALAASLAHTTLQLSALPAEIERLQQAVASLGAVNLAALDELAQGRQRQQFLAAQHADLQQAMATLESAIKKIDNETRDLLLGTFHTVDGHFGRIFPELFGGGNARLVLDGQEVLDCGVQLVAQPPGKKNQGIALLSGGEKALTAIALVFAMFELNPAPFCLLDEVDAPLDDANTERYAGLVKAMSSRTQFLFISHNKIAIEMAQQLVGVTMQEPGVSRIVAVDMEAVLALADQGG